jgi:hypothetical protein
VGGVSAVVVDALSGAVVHVGQVEAVLERAVVVRSPRGGAWLFRRRDGRGVGSVDDLKLSGDSWR